MHLLTRLKYVSGVSGHVREYLLRVVSTCGNRTLPGPWLGGPLHRVHRQRLHFVIGAAAARGQRPSWLVLVLAASR